MTKKLVIPWELKYKFAMGAYASGWKGWLYSVREECGAATTLKIFERVQKLDDRIKNFTKTVLKVFKLEGNDAETIAQWWDIWFELCGFEWTWPERSKTITRFKVTKCPFKTEPTDISSWALIFVNLATKTINPKTSVERPKGMCAGDPYCEYTIKMEE
jgi:hypothetical protein